MLSVIVPAYNEEPVIEQAYHAISETLSHAQIAHEIIFIDDGSTDATFEVIRSMANTYPNLRGLRFSRNFGKEAAISAGLAASEGECVVVIDCDLQHPPAKIVEMFRLWEEGYEIVEGVKSSRGAEGKMRGFAVKTFYSLISAVVGFDMKNASDFKLLDRKVVDVLNHIPEQKGFFRALSYWVGYRRTSVEFDVEKRVAGVSKWSTWGLIKYAASNISSYSTAPMQIVTILGVLMLLIACGFGVWMLTDWFCGNVVSAMKMLILVSVLIGGVLLIGLGVVGYYVARIYDEVKGRPKYIVSSDCRKSSSDGKETES